MKKSSIKSLAYIAGHKETAKWLGTSLQSLQAAINNGYITKPMFNAIKDKKPLDKMFTIDELKQDVVHNHE